jgi:hypothetical protein
VRARELLDELYEAFVATLPAELAPRARRLAHELRLAPSPDIPWSEVFAHDVTLAVPALVADAMPGLPADVVLNAVMSHALAVIEAFGTDRIEDGQVPRDAEIEQILLLARRASAQALARVATAPDIDPAAAHARTLEAIAAERRILSCGRAVSFELYDQVSSDKQSVGFPAAMALAYAAGWDLRRRRALSLLLGSIWVGLQMNDDAHDWEDDLARGGAWPVALLGPRDATLVESRARILSSDVLARLLRGAARKFRGARRLATVLGMERLAWWARDQEEHAGALAERERDSAGFATRARALSGWAAEVLS